MARRRLLWVAYEFADLLMMVLALGIADTAAAHGVPPLHVWSMRVRVGSVVLFLALLAVWHLTFRAAGAYRRDRLASLSTETLRALMAAGWGSCAVLYCTFIFHRNLVTPTFAVAFWIASCLLCVDSRLLARWVLAQVRRGGRNLRNVLIVGTNPRAVEYAARLEERPELGYHVAGFVDDEWPGLDDFRRSGRALVGAPADLAEMLRGQVVDEVAIALPMCSCYARCAGITELCEEQGITVRILSDLFRLKLGRATIEQLEESPVVTIWTGAMAGWEVHLKRLLDIAASSLLLLLLAPLLVAVALVVRLTSPGPALFVQQRIGYNKRHIKVHKFRTMHVDAERRIDEVAHLNEVSGPVFKIRNDPRITRVGRFLRQTSIDELPQLLDVLLGDMSLVGPRPLPLRDYQGFSEDWHRRRLSVRPGITCLWQVAGRSSLPFDKWMELDMQYIDHWSLLLDLKILAWTIPAVLRGTGAA